MAYLVELSLQPRYCPGISFMPADRQFYLRNRQLSPGDPPVRFDPAEVPKRVWYESGGKTIPDFCAIHSRLALSPEARDLVEALEPGVHQLFPVEIVRPRSRKPIYRLDGRVLDTPWYIFNIQVELDAVWVERSRVRVSTFEGGVCPQPPLVHRLPGSFDIVLRRDITAGHHVWRGARHLHGDIFFSDELVAAIQARKLRGIELRHLKEA